MSVKKIFALETGKMQRLPLVLLLVVSIALSCINAVHVNELVCPPAEDILPCVCEYTPPVTHKRIPPMTDIKCYNLKTQQALREIFENNPNFQFTNLNIHNSSMSFIPTFIFDNARFKALKIYTSSFMALFDKPPTSDSLERILIRDTVFQRGVDWRWFSNLTINVLLFDGVVVRKIGRSFWEGIPKTLEGFFLNDTSTTTIRPHNFENFETRLREIEIEHGRVKKLEPNSFPKTVKVLYLDYNRIETLPDGVFDSIWSLNIVSLKGNLLTTIRYEVFGSIPLTYLENNPIKCDCRIHWALQRRGKILDTRCVGPAPVRGKLIKDLKEDDFSYCKSFANNEIV